MRIALVASDTRGGIQPYVALGVGLQAAGHDVRFIAPSDAAPLLHARGLRHFPLTGNVEEVVRASGGVAQKGSLASVRFAQREAARIVSQWSRETLEASQGVDLMAGGIGGMIAGLPAAERLRVPFVRAHLQPIGAPTSAFPGVLFPRVPRWTGAAGRRLSHTLTELALWAPFRGALKKARQALGLTGTPVSALAGPVLFGFSRHVVPEAPEWRGQCFVTGYWTLPPEPGWSPPRGLEEFLRKPGPVVCIGFGSMANEDPKATAALVLEALRRAHVRAVVISGWGGLEVAASDDVFAAASIPYDWLYPRVAAAVHHGGAGTTGASLAAGIPTVVVPFLMDQPFWGLRVAALGAGPDPIPRRRLTAERLATALSRVLSDEAMRRRAVELGARIRAEDGVREALAHFERLAPSHRD